LQALKTDAVNNFISRQNREVPGIRSLSVRGSNPVNCVIATVWVREPIRQVAPDASVVGETRQYFPFACAPGSQSNSVSAAGHLSNLSPCSPSKKALQLTNLIAVPSRRGNV